VLDPSTRDREFTLRRLLLMKEICSEYFFLSQYKAVKQIFHFPTLFKITNFIREIEMTDLHLFIHVAFLFVNDCISIITSVSIIGAIQCSHGDVP
jgi:hypothetical protein